MTATTVHRSVIYSFNFYVQRNIGTHTADTFTAVQTRSSSSATLRQITSPLSTCFSYFYSPPLGRDLWTRVRWPTGQVCGHRRKGRDFRTTVRHECCQSSRMQDRWTARMLSSSHMQMYGVTSSPAHIIICWLVQTNLSAQLVSAHSLSSTSLLIVLILTILATNISLLPLWRNYLELWTYITSLILQKKLIFTASYDVYKHFYNSYLALILR